MIKKWIFAISLISVIFASAFVISCGGPDSDKMQVGENEPEAQTDEHSETENHIKLSPEALETLNIKTTQVKLRNLGGEITTTAVIEPDHTRIAHVSPRISGRAIDIKAHLGDQLNLKLAAAAWNLNKWMRQLLFWLMQKLSLRLRLTSI